MNRPGNQMGLLVFKRYEKSLMYLLIAWKNSFDRSIISTFEVLP